MESVKSGEQSCREEKDKHELAMDTLDRLESAVKKLENLLDRIRGDVKTAVPPVPQKVVPLSLFLETVLLERIQNSTSRISEIGVSISSLIF